MAYDEVLNNRRVYRHHRYILITLIVYKAKPFLVATVAQNSLFSRIYDKRDEDVLMMRTHITYYNIISNYCHTPYVIRVQRKTVQNIVPEHGPTVKTRDRGKNKARKLYTRITGVLPRRQM